MARREGAMHLVTTRRHYTAKDGNVTTYENTLLRRSYRDDGKVKNETLANLSHLPPAAIDLIRGTLEGKAFLEADSDVTIVRSLPHGDVAAVGAIAKTVGLETLLGTQCRERDLAIALIISRVCNPDSKLATTKWWSDTTVGIDFGIDGASTDEVYRAMDWLLDRQDAIESTLARRHLRDGGNALYDLSSSWLEGTSCPLGARGYSRDGKSAKLQIEYGLLTDSDGRPVSIQVFPGNTADPSAFIEAVDKVKTKFGLGHLTMIGDRGMITSARITAMKEHTDLDWVSALRGPAIKKLVESGAIQLSLFDEQNLIEIEHPDYPGERLVVCRNQDLAIKRTHTRESLLAATEADLVKLAERASKDAQKKITKTSLVDPSDIGVAAGKIINRRKVGKHFVLDIAQGSLRFSRNQENIDNEARTDGLYVIRTSVNDKKLTSTQTVDAYKSLANVESAFRSIKVDDLDLRPVRHWREDRVRSHVLILMLARYLVWHLEAAWAPLTFHDTDKPVPQDPVVAKKRSTSAIRKASRKQDDQGNEVMSFSSLLAHLKTLTRNTINIVGGTTAQVIAIPTPTQRRAFELLGLSQTPRTVM